MLAITCVGVKSAPMPKSYTFHVFSGREGVERCLGRDAVDPSWPSVEPPKKIEFLKSDLMAIVV